MIAAGGSSGDAGSNMLEPYIRERLRQRELLLMTHLVVGYPSLAANRRMLACMQEAGVDLVELQMPFSEPIADGPVFIKANQGALRGGLKREDYFRFLRWAARAVDMPLLFMGYCNTVYRAGQQAFCRKLAKAGGRGMIVADLPPQEAGELVRHARESKLDFIRLMTPTDTDRRLREVAEGASGFIYCVARRGVTGRVTDLGSALRSYLKRCRAATRLPLGVGFGIREAKHVALLRGTADIAIVGTACLENWEQGSQRSYVSFLKSLRKAAD
jgi:tryptophan synthase alpha chain